MVETTADIALKFCNQAFPLPSDAPKVGIVMDIARGLDDAVKQRDAARRALEAALRELATVRQLMRDENLSIPAELLTPTLSTIKGGLRESIA